MSDITIREYRDSDADAICEIFSDVVKGGDTYDFSPETPREEAISYFTTNGSKCFVAVIDGKVAGMYGIRKNRRDLGSHIGNASYMISKDFRGHGVGKALGKHSIEYGKQIGFKGIQFNFVVSTNTVAVELWQSLGWEIIGVTPGGFKHSKLGFVDSYIMFRKL